MPIIQLQASISFISIEVDGKEYNVDMYRGNAEYVFEAFPTYAIRILTPLIHEFIPAANTLRCLVTGFPIATLGAEELHELIISAVYSEKLDALSYLLSTASAEEVKNGLEAVMAQLITRMVLSAKKSPTLSYANRQPVLASLAKPRQLSLLVNQLLYDAGHYRDMNIGLEDQMIRNQKSFAMADNIAMLWGKEVILEELRLALIELDAKYKIFGIKLDRHEEETVIQFRNADALQITELLSFVMQLIGRRDAEPAANVNTDARWTKQSYAREARTTAQRVEYSNLVKPENRPAHYVPKSATGSTGPLTGEAKAKFEKKNFMADLLKSAGLAGGM